MRNAYALLGIMFIIVFIGVYLSSREAQAPTFLVDHKQDNIMSLSLTSEAFETNDFIPEKYSCDGLNISPPLTISGTPVGTKSFVLLMYDPDIPNEIKQQRGIDKFDHWVVYNIPPDTTEIKEGGGLGQTGQNGSGKNTYTGPCPPTQYQPTTHRYIFRLYALSDSLTFEQVPNLDDIERAAQAMIIEKAELIGYFSRSERKQQ